MFNIGSKVVRDGTEQTRGWCSSCDLVGFNRHSPLTVTSVNPYSRTITFKEVGGAWDREKFSEVPSDVNLTQPEPEYTGGSSSYYTVGISNPTTKGKPAYTAECNDIIEALGMNYAEGNAFKALWRRAAQRTLGKAKAGAKADGLYDAEKVEFFGARLVEQSKLLKVD